MPAEKYWAADDKSTLQQPHHGWYEVLKLDGSPPQPPMMPSYKAESAFEAAKAAGLTLAEALITPITCTACVWELENGDLERNELHTCEE